MKKKELKHNYKCLLKAYQDLLSGLYQMQYLGAYKGVPFFIPMNTEIDLRNDIMVELLDRVSVKFIGTIMEIPIYIPTNTDPEDVRRLEYTITQTWGGIQHDG